jgi:ABC-type dipeptide/oligopeptide/nickel transport system ATPase component
MSEIVAVTGISGSGKTILSKTLAALFPDRIARLNGDGYFKRIDKYARTPDGIDFDHPGNLDKNKLIADIEALRSGYGIRAPLYDFYGDRHPDPLNPGKFIAGAQVGETYVPAHKIILLDSFQALTLPKGIIDRVLYINVTEKAAFDWIHEKRIHTSHAYFENFIIPSFEATTVAMLGEHLQHLFIIDGMQEPLGIVHQSVQALNEGRRNILPNNFQSLPRVN